MAALTFFFKETVTGFFPEPMVLGSEDHIFRELLVTVWNRILLRLQDAQVTSRELEEIGFMLRRVWVVAEAYKAKRKEYSFAEWIQKLTGLAKEAGIPVPQV